MNIRTEFSTGLVPDIGEPLEDDERILWQGRPSGRVRVTWARCVTSVFGLIYVAFALFWMSAAASIVDGQGPLLAALPLLGLPVALIGANMAVGQYLWDAIRRRRTWYTLTDRRAMISRKVFGRRNTASHTIDHRTRLDFKHRRDGSGTIWFGSGRRRWLGRKSRRAGFEMIDDVRRVHKMMRYIQKEAG